MYGVSGTIIKPDRATQSAFWTFDFSPVNAKHVAVFPAANVNASRSFDTSSQVTVTSLCSGADCFAAGDYVHLSGTVDGANPGLNLFEQDNRIQSIAGNTLMMERAIKIPLRATQATTLNQLTSLTMMQPIVIHDMTFDGSDLHCLNSCTFACVLGGINIGPIVNLQMANVAGQYFRDAAVSVHAYTSTLSYISTTHSGSVGYSSQQYLSLTGTTLDHLSSTNDTGFGPQFFRGVDDAVNYLTIDGAGTGPAGKCLGGSNNQGPCPQDGSATCCPGSVCERGGRGLKTQGLGYSTFSNVTSNNNFYSGVAFVSGTYRITGTNITALNNKGIGLWFNGTDNEYNTITGGNFHANGSDHVNGENFYQPDINFYLTDVNNYVSASYDVCWNNFLNCPLGDQNNTVIKVVP